MASGTVFENRGRECPRLGHDCRPASRRTRPIWCPPAPPHRRRRRRRSQAPHAGGTRCVTTRCDHPDPLARSHPSAGTARLRHRRCGGSGHPRERCQSPARTYHPPLLNAAAPDRSQRAWTGTTPSTSLPCIQASCWPTLREWHGFILRLRTRTSTSTRPREILSALCFRLSTLPGPRVCYAVTPR